MADVVPPVVRFGCWSIAPIFPWPAGESWNAPPFVEFWRRGKMKKIKLDAGGRVWEDSILTREHLRPSPRSQP